MLWLGVHFPLLPLEVVPAREAPRVVIDERSRVVFRNTAALAAGIAHGSTLATAHSIVSGLVHHLRNPEWEQRRLALLAEALYGFSPRISVAAETVADGPPGGVMLEIGGSLRLFGDPDELTRQVETLCRDMGHQVRVRRADTPLAALVLARSGAHVLSRVALEHAVEARGLTAERLERFANLGIHTLGQLLELPRRGLAQRFGQALVDYLDRLTGERPDPRPAIRPAERFHAALHLLEPLNSKEALAFPMQRLLNDLHHWLVARQLGAEQLHWHFIGSGVTAGADKQAHIPVRFARAQQRREAFLEITRLTLAEAVLPEDVISLELTARQLTPWSTGSRGLFGNLPGMQSAEEMENLGELVDQLRARLGQSACHTLEVADQHTPEQAWRRTPPLRVLRSDGDEIVGPRKRPLWLFDPPRPVERRQLELLDGPERIHTGWWLTARASEGPPGQARDYYVALHSSGARCWVFADPEERWFLHGYFA